MGELKKYVEIHMTIAEEGGVESAGRWEGDFLSHLHSFLYSYMPAYFLLYVLGHLCSNSSSLLPHHPPSVTLLVIFLSPPYQEVIAATAISVVVSVLESQQLFSRIFVRRGYWQQMQEWILRRPLLQSESSWETAVVF